MRLRQSQSADMGTARERAKERPVPGSTDQTAGARRGFKGRIAGLFAGRRRAPMLEAGVRVYAVGDIHGCTAELGRLMDAILSDRADWDGTCHLVFLGDYVDRGPDSRGTVERLLAPPAGFEVRYLRGNHEQTLLDFVDDASLYRGWKDFGGRETLLSYGVTPPRFDEPSALEEARLAFRSALPPSHLAFFHSLPLSLTIGSYFFAHAGVRPGVVLERQSAEDLMWIRDEFLLSPVDFGKVVVHGHTPTEQPVRRANRIGVDTGAYATGLLTAAVLEGETCRFLSS